MVQRVFTRLPSAMTWTATEKRKPISLESIRQTFLTVTEIPCRIIPESPKNQSACVQYTPAYGGTGKKGPWK